MSEGKWMHSRGRFPRTILPDSAGGGSGIKVAMVAVPAGIRLISPTSPVIICPLGIDVIAQIICGDGLQSLGLAQITVSRDDDAGCSGLLWRKTYEAILSGQEYVSRIDSAARIHVSAEVGQISSLQALLPDLKHIG